MRVFILDGNERQALAATRALGRAGYAVTVGESVPRCLAGASRHASAQVVYPSPYDSPLAFMDWVRTRLRPQSVDAILPMTEVTTDLVLRCDTPALAPLCRALAPLWAVDALSDKVALYRRALELGVPVPHSAVVASASDIDGAVRDIGFPAVLKPHRSRVLRNHGFVSTSVRAVHDRSALTQLIDEEVFAEYPFLYQQRVSGHGQGVFALYDRGKPLAFFAHRRLREKPPDGGVSVLSESSAPDPELVRLARRLLDDVGWHGVAMVEFKVSADGTPHLMEVNARFWGSLQLAIDAGVDFPRLLLDATYGRRVNGRQHSATGTAAPGRPRTGTTAMSNGNSRRSENPTIDQTGRYFGADATAAPTMPTEAAPQATTDPLQAATATTFAQAPDHSVDGIAGYRTGRRLRWWLGDLDRLYLVMKRWRTRPASELLTETLRFIRPDPIRTRHEVFRWRDPWPAARELARYLRHLRGSRRAARPLRDRQGGARRQ